MQEEIEKIFDMIGMSKNETKIYLELLRKNSLTALELSRKTSIHRSNIYDGLRKLISKGLVSEIINGKTRNYNALPPSKIKNYLKQQEYEIDSLLPSLNNIAKNDDSKDKVEIISSVFSIRQKLTDLLDIGLDINVFGASQKSVETFGEGFLNEFHKERLKRKIFMRHIYDDNSIKRVKFLNKKAYTEAKLLAKKYSTNTATIICGDTILILVFTAPANGLVIKNKDIADAYSKYFEVLWKQAYTMKSPENKHLDNFYPEKKIELTEKNIELTEKEIEISDINKQCLIFSP